MWLAVIVLVVLVVVSWPEYSGCLCARQKILSGCPIDDKIGMPSNKYNIPQPPVDGPQYPYRVTDDMSPADAEKVRDAIAVVIAETDDMVVGIAMNWFRSRERHELDDIISEMVLYALKHVLPNYDVTKGTKATSYLYQGYTYGAMQAHQKRKKSREMDAKVTAAGIDKERYNNSHSDTDYVYGIAEELVNHPEKYFNGSTAKYLRALHGDTDMRDCKDYGHPTTISRARNSVYALVSDMSIEPGEDLTKYQKGQKRTLEGLKMLEMHDSGMSYDKIAEATGRCIDTVRSRIRKAQTNSKSPTP